MTPHCTHNIKPPPPLHDHSRESCLPTRPLVYPSMGTDWKRVLSDIPWSINKILQVAYFDSLLFSTRRTPTKDVMFSIQ